MCFDNAFELNTKNDYNFDYIRANAEHMLDTNEDISHYEIYIISKAVRGDYRNNIMKYSKRLEDMWKSPLISDEVPQELKSNSLLVPYSTRKMKAIKLIQRLWRRARYNPDYALNKKWCKHIQKMYYD